MAVFHPEEGINSKLVDIKAELGKLNSKVDTLIKNQEVSNVKTEYALGFVLKSQEGVIWWTKVENAARYHLIIKINLDEVGSIDLDRETRFYVFGKMPKGVYAFVKVIAEDREGKEIVSATIEL